MDRKALGSYTVRKKTAFRRQRRPQRQTYIPKARRAAIFFFFWQVQMSRTEKYTRKLQKLLSLSTSSLPVESDSNQAWRKFNVRRTYGQPADSSPGQTNQPELEKLPGQVIRLELATNPDEMTCWKRDGEQWSCNLGFDACANFVQNKENPTNPPILINNRAESLVLGGETYTVINVHATSADAEGAVKQVFSALNAANEVWSNKVIFGGDGNMYYGDESGQIGEHMINFATQAKSLGYQTYIVNRPVTKGRPSNGFINAQAIYKAEPDGTEETMFMCVPEDVDVAPLPFVMKVEPGVTQASDTLLEAVQGFRNAMQKISGAKAAVFDLAHQVDLPILSDHFPIGGTLSARNDKKRVIFSNNMSIVHPRRGFTSKTRTGAPLRSNLTRKELDDVYSKLRTTVLKHFRNVWNNQQATDLKKLSLAKFDKQFTEILSTGPLLPTLQDQDEIRRIKQEIENMVATMNEQVTPLLRDSTLPENLQKVPTFVSKWWSKKVDKSAPPQAGAKSGADYALKYITNLYFSELQFEGISGFQVPPGFQMGFQTAEEWWKEMHMQLRQFDADNETDLIMSCEDYSLKNHDDKSIATSVNITI